MTERINSIGLQEFLKDFKDNSRTEVYESGKEKEEIIAIAKAKMGIDLKNNIDLAGFKTIYTFADIANGNGARLPKYLLLKALPSLIGKPVNINHIRNYVVGYYIDYRYIESENKVIAYGLFFKSNFGQEWSEAKQLLKSNLLGTSHEVWCPRKSRKYLSDGTYEAQAIEFAGGALIYRNHPDAINPDKKMETAYKGCDVLETAMKYMNKNQKDLIFASLQIPTEKHYDEEDLVTANQSEETNQKPEESQENPQVVQVPKVKCKNCGFEFETNEVGELSCSECRAIIDRAGNVLYPPQKINFSFRDPIDGSSNWRLINETDSKVIIKNIDNGKIYELSYVTKNDNDELMNRLKFVYIGHASCPQCGHGASFSTVSHVNVYEIECKHCGLKYQTNIKKDSLRKQISAYRDITEEYKSNKPSEEGETQVIVDKEKELSVANLEQNAVVNDFELEVADLQEECELETANLSSEGTPSEESPKHFEIASITIHEPKPLKIDYSRSLVRKAVRKIMDLKKRLDLDTANLKSANAQSAAKIQEDADKKINWYKANAVELIKRRESLGEFADDLSDEKIMDNDIYAKLNLEMENALLKASQENGDDVVGDKYILGKNDSEMTRLKNEIDSKAFNHS